MATLTHPFLSSQQLAWNIQGTREHQESERSCEGTTTPQALHLGWLGATPPLILSEFPWFQVWASLGRWANLTLTAPSSAELGISGWIFAMFDFWLKLKSVQINFSRCFHPSLTFSKLFHRHLNNREKVIFIETMARGKSSHRGPNVEQHSSLSSVSSEPHFLRFRVLRAAYCICRFDVDSGCSVSSPNHLLTPRFFSWSACLYCFFPGKQRWEKLKRCFKSGSLCYSLIWWPPITQAGKELLHFLPHHKKCL